MHRHLPSFAIALLSTGLAAQVIVPASRATVEGLSSNTYPWARTTAAIRNQFCWDSSHFTGYGLSGPIAISGVRFRANGTTATYTGGTYNNVLIDVSSATADYSALSTTFDSNHGPDRVNVVNGSVTVAPTPGGTPGIWYIDINFSAPFIYNPSLGSDLLMDIRFNAGNWVGGTANSCDIESAVGVANGSRVYSTSAWTGTPAVPPAIGSLTNNYAAVVDFKVAGFASATNYGQGCMNIKTSVYENFPASTIDLGAATGTNSLAFIPNGQGGYFVTQGTNAFYTPTSPDLLLTDDSLSATQLLPFTFNFPGGSTSSIKLCSNGYIWLDATQTIADLSATQAELLSLAPRMALVWNDLNPAVIDPVTTLRFGTVTFETDPATGDAVCTWLNVPQYGTGSATTPARLNTFQLALRANGSFEYRFQGIATTNIVVTGFSEGRGANDPGMANLSDAWTTPINTGLRAAPLQLNASGRPIIGGAGINLVVSEIFTGSPLGILLLSFTQINPGVDLSPLGMPTCFQYSGTDVPIYFVPAGSTATYALAIPNTPSLSGLPLVSQAATFAASLNPLGIVTSNGVAMVLGTL